jgi:hypothetical protein
MEATADIVLFVFNDARPSFRRGTIFFDINLQTKELGLWQM